MKKSIIILIFLLASVNIFAQSDWHFEAKTERSKHHYLLEGSIDDKYPITMYLERDRFCLYEYRGNIVYRLKGWYYYNSRKIKLPLIGSETIPYSDRFDICKVTLYVPTDISDSIRENSCDLEDFKEIFVTNEAYSFESLQWSWRTNNNKSLLPVKLKEISKPSIEIKHSILLHVRGIEMFSFDLTDNLRNSDNFYGNYVEQVNIEVSKLIDNDFYLIFSFSIPSNPGSYGMGNCGAGYEDYLGFLHIKSFELKEFKYFHTTSCISSFEEKYTYDKTAPEKGITENEIEK
jgi:hypothetical protein